MEKPSILVIDDEPDNFDVIETLLSIGIDNDKASLISNQGYDLNYAASGQEAIASLDTFQPDLILLDVMMPGMDGIEVCQRIKTMSKWQATPIIMVTALTAKEDLAHCLKSGADDFISKPVNPLELRARVQSMLRIKQQHDELQNLLKFREDMVNMMVHDLRSPLTSILFGLELLKNPQYPQEKHEYQRNQIHSSARALQVLIDDLLKVALLESGKLCLKRKKVNIYNLVQSAISNFKAIASQKNQLLVSQLINKSNQQVSVDSAMMHRTLDNLLSNAIKFSPHDSQIVVNVEFPNSSDCRIQIIDSGPGVPDGLSQKIFEKYEVGNLMSGVSQIGLGLAFCKMVVEAHGGNICVRNNQPQGAIFEISLAA